MTYCATAVTTDGAVGVVEGAILVAALVAEVVSNELDIEVELLGGGRGVGEDGEELSGAGVADTQVDGSPVTDGLGAIAPLATLLSRHTLGVNVVLGRGGLAFPVEVGVAVGASQGVSVTRGGGKRNGLRLGTGVVSTANGDVSGHLVLDVDTANTGDTELLVLGVGKVQLSVFTLETTNGLASGALGGGPLGLLVTGRASVRAHSTVVALITSDGGHNIADKVIDQGNVLDTGVTTQTEVVKGNSTVFRGECAAVDLSIGEVGVETGGTRAAGAGGAAGRAAGCRGRGDGAGGAGGGLGSAGGAGRGDGSSSLLEDSRGDSGSRGGGRRRGGCGSASAAAGGGRRAGSGDSTIKPFKLVLGKTLAGIVDADGLRGSGLGWVHHHKIIHDGSWDRNSLSLSGALVVVSMAVAVCSRKTSRRQCGNSVGELHVIGSANLSGKE